MANVFFILVEGLEDWPHSVPIVEWTGSEAFARILTDGLRAEFQEEAPSLKFSYISPTTPEDLVALVSKLSATRDEGEFGEQVQAVVRAADRQKAFLKAKESPKSEGNSDDSTSASPAMLPAANSEQDEGNGEAGSTPELPADVSEKDKLALADKKAYFTYSYVEFKIVKPTDRDAYDWLKENGLPDEREASDLAKELTGYTLPAFDTWSRQLRNARKALGEQKHSTL
jgi:hypothetical protein